MQYFAITVMRWYLSYCYHLMAGQYHIYRRVQSINTWYIKQVISLRYHIFDIECSKNTYYRRVVLKYSACTWQIVFSPRVLHLLVFLLSNYSSFSRFIHWSLTCLTYWYCQMLGMMQPGVANHLDSRTDGVGTARPCFSCTGCPVTPTLTARYTSTHRTTKTT